MPSSQFNSLLRLLLIVTFSSQLILLCQASVIDYALGVENRLEVVDAKELKLAEGYLSKTTTSYENQDTTYQILDSLASYYKAIDINRSYGFQIRALKKAISSENDLWIYESRLRLGSIYEELEESDQAISNFEEALQVASNAKDSVKVFTTLAYTYQSRGDNGKAAELLIGCLNDLGKQPTETKVNLLNSMGNFYRGIKEPDKARYYFNQVLDLMIELKIDRLYVPYSNIGIVFLDQNELDSAILYFNEGYKYIDQEKNKFSLSIYHNNVGSAYNDKGDNKAALPHALKAAELKEEMGLIGRLANSYNLLSSIYLELRQYEEAETYALAALERQDSSRADNVKFNSLRYLVAAQLGKKGLSDINNTVKELQNIESRRFQQEKTESIAEAEARYELDLKEAKLVQQTSQRNALLIGIGLLGIISLLIYRSQRIKSRVNDQLKETEALKNRWLANVSHELKTPLTLVQAPLTKVLDSGKLNEIDRNNIKVANRSVKQLKRLVSEILDLTKLDKGHLELHPAIIDFADLIRVTSYAFESLAISRGTQLRVEAEASCWMYLDEHQMRKTIENLLTNALKFTKQDDTVTVTLKEEKETINLTVTDTGMGIS